MNIERKYPKGYIMLGLLFCFMISCGTDHKLPIATFKPHEVEVTVMPVVTLPTVIDTPKLVQNAKSLNINPEVQYLIKKNDTEDDANKLRELNIKWQELTLRVIDSARNRKKDKDSVLTILKSFKSDNQKQLQDMQRQSNSRFDTVLAAKNLSVSTYSMFETLGTVCFVIIILSYIIAAFIWFAKKFAKQTSAV